MGWLFAAEAATEAPMAPGAADWTTELFLAHRRVSGRFRRLGGRFGPHCQALAFGIGGCGPFAFGDFLGLLFQPFAFEAFGLDPFGFDRGGGSGSVLVGTLALDALGLGDRRGLGQACAFRLRRRLCIRHAFSFRLRRSFSLVLDSGLLSRAFGFGCPFGLGRRLGIGCGLLGTFALGDLRRCGRRDRGFGRLDRRPDERPPRPPGSERAP